MKISLSILTVLTASFMLNSCCCFINGQDQDVDIRANVPQAQIFIDGIVHGTTPGAVTLERDETYNLEVRKEGYYPYRQRLDADFSGWFAGNLIFGGVFGMILDLCTGSCWSFDDVNATLTPISGQEGRGTTVVATRPISTQTAAQNSNEVIRPGLRGSYTDQTLHNIRQTRDNVSSSSQPMDGFFDSVFGEN